MRDRLLSHSPGPTTRTGTGWRPPDGRGILRKLGHRVRIASESYEGRRFDLDGCNPCCWRSADAIERFKCCIPPVRLGKAAQRAPILYDHQRSDPGPTLRSMVAGRPAERPGADLAAKAVPKKTEEAAPHHFPVRPPRRHGARERPARSAMSSRGGDWPSARDAKGPRRRAAEAARLLPAEGRIRIEQVGRVPT